MADLAPGKNRAFHKVWLGQVRVHQERLNLTSAKLKKMNTKITKNKERFKKMKM